MLLGNVQHSDHTQLLRKKRLRAIRSSLKSLLARNLTSIPHLSVALSWAAMLMT